MQGYDICTLKAGGNIAGSYKEDGLLYSIADSIKILQDKGKKVEIVTSAFKGDLGDITDTLVSPNKIIQTEGLSGFGNRLYSPHEKFAKNYGIWDGSVKAFLDLVVDDAKKTAKELYTLEQTLLKVAGSGNVPEMVFRQKDHLVKLAVDIYNGIGEISGNLDSSYIKDKISGDVGKFKQLVEPIFNYIVALKYFEVMDKLLHFGEKIDAPLIARVLETRGLKTYSLADNEIGLITNRNHTNAYPIDEISRHFVQRTVEPLFKEGYVVVIPGFFGVTFPGIEKFLKGEDISSKDLKPEFYQELLLKVQENLENGSTRITTLGRGGSELTAACYQKYLDGVSYWLKRLVGGIETGPPSILKGKGKVVSTIDYRQAKFCKGIQTKGLTRLMGTGYHINILGIDDFSHLVKGEGDTIMTTVKGNPDSGPQLKDGKETYITFVEREALQMKIKGVENEKGELEKISGVLSRYGFNIIGGRTAFDIVNLITLGNMGQLERAASELRSMGFNEEKGVSIKMGECSYVSLVGKRIKGGDRRTLEKLVDGILGEHSIISMSGKETDNSVVWISVPRTYGDLIATAIHDVFVDKKELEDAINEYRTQVNK